MSKDRNILCEHYIRAHTCTKGRDAMVNGTCRNCIFYVKSKGSKPFRTNNKRKKIERVERREY